MITKVTHGWRPGGLVAYLMGPGTAEEHVRPRVIASWDGLDAGWQPEIGPRGDFDFRLGPLIGALHVPATRAGLPVSGQGPSGRGYVWHCSVRLSAEDRTLSDAEWAGVARRLLACVPRNSVGLEAMILALSCGNASRHALGACL